MARPYLFSSMVGAIKGLQKMSKEDKYMPIENMIQVMAKAISEELLLVD